MVLSTRMRVEAKLEEVCEMERLEGVRKKPWKLHHKCSHGQRCYMILVSAHQSLKLKLLLLLFFRMTYFSSISSKILYMNAGNVVAMSTIVAMPSRMSGRKMKMENCMLALSAASSFGPALSGSLRGLQNCGPPVFEFKF
ncbi:hypothetical protein EJB05_27586, partial [Eragrostis curvula]